MQPFFHIQQLSFHTREPSALCPALSPVSLDINPREHLICYDPYSVGNALFLYLVAGLIQPVQGSITLGQEHAMCRSTLFTVQHQLLSLRTQYALPQDPASEPLTTPELETLLFHPVQKASPARQRLWLQLLFQSGFSEDLILLDRLFCYLTPDSEKAYLDTLFRIRMESAVTLVSAVTSLSEALLLGTRILLFDRSPVTVCREYPLPFADASPAERMQHRDYHLVYQDLSDMVHELHPPCISNAVT